MVSLKQSITDYDRAHHLASELIDTLKSTLQCLKQYVVETEPTLVEGFRHHAETVIGTIDKCIESPDEKSFGEVRSSIRGGLRDYYDRAGLYINPLRSSLSATTEALHEMLAIVQSGDSDAEDQLKNEISRLKVLEQSSSMDELRSGLRQTVTSLGKCVEQLRQEKDVVIMQLRDEIRTLQSSVEQAKTAAVVDTSTNVCNRTQFETLITQEIARGCAFSILRMSLQNLRDLCRWYQPNTIDQLLNAFSKRARGVLPEGATMGRWQETVFCALIPSTDVKTVVSTVLNKCSGNYACMEQSYARTLYLDVRLSMLTVTAGSNARKVAQSLDEY